MDKDSDVKAQNVVTLVETVLQQTQDRFQTMSDQILRRIDEMAKRVDDLEKNISELMTEAGVNTASSTTLGNINKTK